MSTLPQLLQPTFGVAEQPSSVTDISPAILLNAALSTHPHVRTAYYATRSADLRKVPGVIASIKSEDRNEVVVQCVDALASLTLSSGSLHIRVVGLTVHAADEALKQFTEQFPPLERFSQSMINVAFWSDSRHGPRSRMRMIHVPSWEDVKANYPQSTVGDLSWLINDFKPSSGGQLILWHGPPGTGKTFALRALGWEWREWCSLHYITDPEVFFGHSADYMLQVLLAGDDEDLTPEEEEHAVDKWRVLVMEDTGEMLSADAKERAGQGLSRLLNVVDGLIGQGLKVLVLVTTNETIKTLHPAVSRPGRCAARITFDSFPAHEAEAWFEEHGTTEGVGRNMTIADLYERAGEGVSLNGTKPKAAVGFG